MILDNLPGHELVLPGIEDLHNGKSNTIEALLVAIASIRLTKAGLDVPSYRIETEPEMKLYALLVSQRNDAYPYYNALLYSLNSFCNALEFNNRYYMSDSQTK